MGSLILGAPVPPESCLFWDYDAVCLKVPLHALIDDALNGLTDAASETDRAVASNFAFVLALLQDGDHLGVSPALWYLSCAPTEIENVQEFAHQQETN